MAEGSEKGDAGGSVEAPHFLDGALTGVKTCEVRIAEGWHSAGQSCLQANLSTSRGQSDSTKGSQCLSSCGFIGAVVL